MGVFGDPLYARRASKWSKLTGAVSVLARGFGWMGSAGVKVLGQQYDGEFERWLDT